MQSSKAAYSGESNERYGSGVDRVQTAKEPADLRVYKLRASCRRLLLRLEKIIPHRRTRFRVCSVLVPRFRNRRVATAKLAVSTMQKVVLRNSSAAVPTLRPS